MAYLRTRDKPGQGVYGGSSSPLTIGGPAIPTLPFAAGRNGPTTNYPPNRTIYSNSTPSRAPPQLVPAAALPASYSNRSVPTRQAAQYAQNTQTTQIRHAQPQNGPTQPTQTQVYHHPSTYNHGPLPFFLAPPGQPTRDPTLSTPPTSQARYTTYPSRLRTGITGLAQPENITGGPREREQLLAELDRELATARSGSGASTPRLDSPASFARRTTLSGRRIGRGGAVNYAEKESEDEVEEEEEDDEMSDVQEATSDPEDGDYGGRGGGRRRVDRDRSSGITPGRVWMGIGTAEQQAAMRAGKLRKKRDEMDRGWTWLGDRVPGERVRSQPFKGTQHHYVSEELLGKEATRPEMLVPITVDFDVATHHPDQQGIKIKDRFLWNINEPFITPRQFSVIFCEDVGIPVQPYAATVAELIQTQLDEAQGTVEIDVMDPMVTEDDVVWSEDEVEDVTEVEVNGSRGDGVVMGDEEGADGNKLNESMQNGDKVNGITGDEDENVQVKTWHEADCRIVVNLDVQIYTHLLRDRIEWDLSSSLPPSIFAKQYCTELGLTGEAIPLIAHAITDELLKHKRDALELELYTQTHPEEQAKYEKAHGGGGPRVTSRQGARGLVGVWRDWWEREEFGPVLVELTMEDMERREVERTREARRMLRTLASAKRRR